MQMFERIVRRYSSNVVFVAVVAVIFLSVAVPLTLAQALNLSLDATTGLLFVITAPVSIIAFVVGMGTLLSGVSAHETDLAG